MKKSLKILMLLLSVALIVGALAVVIGATGESEPDMAELYVDGDYQGSVPFSDAIAFIPEVEGTEFEIKLLGDCETLDTLAFTTFATEGEHTVVIDLNGYTLNGATPSILFQTAEGVTLNVVGSGTVNFGATLAKVAAGSSFSIVSESYGIKAVSTTKTTSIIDASAGNASVTLKNVDLSVLFSVTVMNATEGTQVWADPNRQYLSGSLVTLVGGSVAVIENSMVSYEVAFTKGAIEEGQTYADAGAAGVWFAKVEGEGSQLVMKNTRAEVASSGLYLNNTTGAACAEVGEGNYSVVLIDSHLECANRNETTLEFLKARNAGNTNDMTYQFVKFGSQVNAEVYFKNSYGSALYRTVEGVYTATAADNKNYLTFDNSTFKQDDSICKAVGKTYGDNGEGILTNGFTHVTFKNGSKIYLGGSSEERFKAGGSSNNGLGEALWKYTDGENTVYALDLEDGTRVNRSTVKYTSVGSGANTALTTDIATDREYPYLVGDYDSNIAHQRFDSPFNTTVRPVYSCTKGTYYGRDNVVKLQAYTEEDVASWKKTDNGDGTVTYDQGLSSNNVVLKFDNNAKTMVCTSTSSQIQDYGTGRTYYKSSTISDITYTGGVAGKVAVVTLDFLTTDKSLPFKFIVNGKNAAGKTGSIHSSLAINTDGTTTRGNVQPYEWHNLTLVYDLSAGSNCITQYWYLDGEHIDTKTQYGDRMIGEYRNEIGTNTVFNQGAELYLGEGHRVLYKEYVGGTFNAADYVKKTVESVANVGNAQFTSVNEALAYANTVGGFVNLTADVSGEAISNTGYVRTNGNTLDCSSTYAMEENALGVRIYKTTTYNVSWYTGVAEDPAADTAKMTTLEFSEGGTISLPDGVTVASVLGNGALMQPSGWATAYVCPVGKTADEYNAAIEGLNVITDFSTETVTQDVTYYPVYTASEGAYITTSQAGAITLYQAEDDLNVAMARVGLEGTITLLSDVTVSGQYKSKTMGSSDSDDFFRSTRTIDFNGHTLTVENGNAAWIDMAGGALNIKSSVPGGMLLQAENSGNAMVNVRSNVTCNVLDPNNYLTVKATRFANVTCWDAAQSRDPVLNINGGTYISLNTNYGDENDKPFIFSSKYNNNAAINIDGATIISVAKGNIFHVHAAVSPNTTIVNIENSSIIDLAGGNVFAGGNERTTYNITDSYIGGVLRDAGAVINLYGNVVAADLDLDSEFVCESGKVVAYDTSATATMPEALGDSYEVNGYVITADTLKANYRIADATATTTYTWNYADADVLSVVAVTGNDVSVFNAKATANTGTTNLNVLVIGADGNWTLDGTTYTCGSKAVGVVSGTGNINLTMHEGFDINFYVTPENYEYLDADSKAKFTLVDKFGGQYYEAFVGSVNVNEAFTEKTITVTLVEGGYTCVATYKADVVGYLKNAISALTEAEDQKIVYYIAAYLNNAYAYFANNDAEEGDVETLAALVSNNSSLYDANDVVRPTVGDAISAEGKLVVAIDLTSTPAYVLNSTVNGTVTFLGEEHDLVAGEELRLSASVLDFDSTLAIELADGTTGSYCLGNYAAYVAGAESIEGVEDLAALKALVAAFYDYVIYAENFRY